MVLAQPQIVLHLCHEQISHTALSAPQDAPVKALLIVKAQIALGIVDILRSDFPPPQLQRAVVVGAGVAHTMPGIGMGQVIAGIPGVKGKFQHLHAGPAGIVQQLLHRGSGIAQILGNKLQLGEPAGQRADEGHAGAFAPLAGLGGFVAVGNRPIGVQSPEMVNTDHVIQLAGTVDTTDPPAVAVIAHSVPAIEGRAP